MSLIERAFEAANQGNDQLLAQLLDGGLAPDTVDADGDSLLDEAAHRRHLNCVRLLLERGAKPNGLRNDGAPLWTACYRLNNAECIREIIEHGGDPNLVQDQESKQTMLMHCSASPSDKRNLAELLKHSPDLDARNDEDESPLSYACAWGNLRAVKMLLDAGLDPNRRVCKGSTALRVALTSHNRTTNSIVHYLIDRGADVNTPDVDPLNGTPYKNLLMFAVSYRLVSPPNVALARRIASLTHDLDYKVDGATALMMAREQGYMEYVDMLRELGAADK
jgi:ankyrin repeat protein